MKHITLLMLAYLTMVPLLSIQASPTKPDSLILKIDTLGGDYRPKLIWKPSTDTLLLNGGHYYVERRRKNSDVYPIVWSAWSNIAILSGTVSSYIDQSITTAGSGSDSVQYRVLAKDSLNQYSPYSDIVGTKYSRDLSKKGLLDISSSGFYLFQNYPNPFNPTTLITYQVPSDGNVRITVYNVLGKEMATLISEYKQAGEYQVNFDASGLSSGIYLYEMRADEFVAVRKMTLMK